ncbi:MAG: glycosyltransferase [Calditrichaeota bacterium]|nr:glycosyltransferase [Calditrichota bacterium]
MRLVIIGPAPPYRGGIANFVTQMYFHLRQRGHTVHIVNFTRQYPDFLFPGKTQYEPDSHTPTVPSVRVIDSVWPPSWVRAAQVVRHFQPDIVVYNHWMPFFAPAYAKIAALLRLKKPPVQICLCHNVTPHETRPGDRLLNRLFLRQLNGHIVLSEAVKKDLETLLPGARIQKVLHPVSETFGGTCSRKEARQKLGLPQKKTLLLFFGYVRRYKGLDLLLKAFARLVQENQPVHLLIVGEFYEPKNQFEVFIQENGLKEFVTLVDEFVPNDQVGLYFSAADAVVMPYRSATQSGIIPIAYQFERPVITTNVGGLPDFVEEGKTGFLVPPENPEALAEGIRLFLEKKETIPFEENIRQFRKNFSWERLVEAIESFVG